ncbi:MAG TPA: TonB family protein [Elusimicrobiota bacterium]|nr:TonB family protein [Elusimicrobiota bacterium]
MSKETDRGLLRELPFWTAALVLHAVLLLANPAMEWGGAVAVAAIAAGPSLPIELVAAPPPAPSLAPAPPVEGDQLKVPGVGPGAYERPREKEGSPEGSKSPARTQRRRLSPAKRAELARKAAARRERRLEARRRAHEKAVERAAADAQRREEARAEAEAERARKLELARELAERKAAQKAAKARNRAAIEEQLASLPNPDETLSDAPAALPAAGPARGRRGSGSGTVDRAGALSAESNLDDPAFDAAGKEGTDSENARPAGGDVSQEGAGGGVGWSIDGPVGNRRLLGRKLPGCPSWVADRALDLTVQIRFQVLEDGSVKKGMVVKKTSGFPDLDKVAMEALGRWRFERAPKGSAAPDTWGVVSFRFTGG